MRKYVPPFLCCSRSRPEIVGVQNTSVLGATNKCIFATNGSPRAWVPPYCQGTIVSNSKLVMDVWTSAGGFGLTSDGFWGIGVFNSSDFARMNFTQYLYGFTWLVRRGVNQIPRDVRMPSRSVHLAHATRRAERSLRAHQLARTLTAT